LIKYFFIVSKYMISSEHGEVAVA